MGRLTCHESVRCEVGIQIYADDIAPVVHALGNRERHTRELEQVCIRNRNRLVWQFFDSCDEGLDLSRRGFNKSCDDAGVREPASARIEAVDAKERNHAPIGAQEAVETLGTRRASPPSFEEDAADYVAAVVDAVRDRFRTGKKVDVRVALRIEDEPDQ